MSTTIKKALIFSGYNSRAVIALCRLLKSMNLNAVIVAIDANDPIFKTSYADWVVYTRTEKILSIELFELIRHLYSKEDALILMPTSEFLNRFALMHRKELLKLMINVPLVDLDLYKQLSDKAAFRKLCIEYDIAVPTEVTCSESSLPFVAKQINFEQGGIQQAKPYLLNTLQQLDAFKKSENPNHYFYENYVNGSSVYLILYMRRSEVYAFSQQNLLQQGMGGSIIAATQDDFEKSETAEKAIRMLKTEGFSGLIMIEFRIDSGEVCMIEANPRCWGPLQFCLDNSPILLWSFLRDCGLLSTEAVCPDKKNSKFYLWTGGWKKDITNAQVVYEHLGVEKLRSVPFPNLLEDDIFCRPDTMPLFLAEINAECFT